VTEQPPDGGPRRRRRAVGPPGAPAGEDPGLDLAREPAPTPGDDDERLRRDQPPHHDRGL